MPCFGSCGGRALRQLRLGRVLLRENGLCFGCFDHRLGGEPHQRSGAVGRHRRGALQPVPDGFFLHFLGCGNLCSRLDHGGRCSRLNHGSRCSRLDRGGRCSRLDRGGRCSRLGHGSRCGRLNHGSRYSRLVRRGCRAGNRLRFGDESGQALAGRRVRLAPRDRGRRAGAVLLPRYGGRCGGAGKPVPDGDGRFVRYGRGRLRTRRGNHGGRFLRRAGAAGDGSFHKAAVFASWRAVDFRNAVRRGTGAFRFRLGARDCHGIIWLLRHLGVVAAVRLGEYLVRRRTLRLGTARRGLRRAGRLDRLRPCRAVLHGPGCLDRLRPRCPGLRGPGRLRARLGPRGGGLRACHLRIGRTCGGLGRALGAESVRVNLEAVRTAVSGYGAGLPQDAAALLNGVALGLRRGARSAFPAALFPAAAEQDRKPSLFPSSIASAGQPSHLTFPCILRAREKKGCRGSFPRQPDSRLASLLFRALLHRPEKAFFLLL